MSPSAASRLSPEDFQDRRMALLRAIAPSGAKSVAVFGHGSAAGASSQSHGALRYLSGWDGHESASLLLFDQSRTTLIVNSPFMEDLARSNCPNIDVIASPLSQWGAQILKQHSGASADCATVGFGEMPLAAHQSIAAQLRLHSFTSVDDALARLRLSKSKEEHAALQAGAAICDDLFASLGGALMRGRPIWQSQIHLETQAKLAGADYCKTWLTVQPKAAGPHYWRGEAQRCPELGDQVLCGVALTVDGYWAHGIRMGSIGPAHPEHTALWHAVHEALLIGRDRLRVGATVADVDAAIASRLDAATRPTWPKAKRFRNGHGLGLSYEEPLCADGFRQSWGNGAFARPEATALTLPNSSVFELHPNLFVPDIGGAALGDMYSVSLQSAQAFLQFPLDMFELTLQIP